MKYSRLRPAIAFLQVKVCAFCGFKACVGAPSFQVSKSRGALAANIGLEGGPLRDAAFHCHRRKGDSFRSERRLLLYHFQKQRRAVHGESFAMQEPHTCGLDKDSDSGDAVCSLASRSLAHRTKSQLVKTPSDPRVTTRHSVVAHSETKPSEAKLASPARNSDAVNSSRPVGLNQTTRLQSPLSAEALDGEEQCLAIAPQIASASSVASSTLSAPLLCQTTATSGGAVFQQTHFKEGNQTIPSTKEAQDDAGKLPQTIESGGSASENSSPFNEKQSVYALLSSVGLEGL